jgi:hypothetical protein
MAVVQQVVLRLVSMWYETPVVNVAGRSDEAAFRAATHSTAWVFGGS